MPIAKGQEWETDRDETPSRFAATRSILPVEVMEHDVMPSCFAPTQPPLQIASKLEAR
jgi:hypothetical protein